MIDHHAAVSIDMQKCAGLIEMGSGEGYSELHRREGNPFLEIGTRLVKCADCVPACRVIGALFKIRNNLRCDIILDSHLIGRHIAVGFAVQVILADFKRVFLQIAGDGVHHAFRREHSLRSAETAKRRIGNRMGFASMRNDRHIFKIITVIRMKHGAVIDRGRQIDGAATAGCKNEFGAADTPLIIKSHLDRNDKIMAFAGHNHVIIPVQPYFCRAACLVGCKGGDCGEPSALRFLATKTATHSPDLDRDRMVRKIKEFCDVVLHFGRVLGR